MNIETKTCSRCLKPVLCANIDTANKIGVSVEPVCLECKPLYPESLLKACIDTFDYALQLRDGTVFRFMSATITGDYVTLALGGVNFEETSGRYLKFGFPRGVDVRLDQIVWCADAPQGS